MKPELYRPANGTEGMWFEEKWCNNCKKIRIGTSAPTKPNECNIYDLSLFYDTDDPEYPKELIFDKNGNACCTAFEKKEAL